MELYKSNGTIANSYSYAPFGEVTQRGNITNPLQWSSEAYDAELGMVYYNFRFYNPVDGRRTSRDPIGELDGGVNLYIIAANSILNDFDILGNSCFSDCLNDHDYTSLIIDSLLAYMLGGPYLNHGYQLFSMLWVIQI
ncbi:RHS repeat domain-containing protein [Akkermansia muciniphila]|uniref:RHS repeat domain-containing protein n=1 Tax=Akkermansia muciniphila TaxID=239935 RepID=UPI0011780D49